LKEVYIPNSVTQIEEDAFMVCTVLESIKYAGTEAEWEAVKKDDEWYYNCGNFTVYYNCEEDAITTEPSPAPSAPSDASAASNSSDSSAASATSDSAVAVA
jgi:hypothetical protein